MRSASPCFAGCSGLPSRRATAATADAVGRSFNIGGGTRATVNEVLETVGRIVGNPVPVTRHDVQKGDVRHTAADTSAARSALGFAPAVGLEEGLSRHADSLKDSA